MEQGLQDLLEKEYTETLRRGCDIWPYQEMLSRYAQKCRIVTEMGIGPVHMGLNSTWCLLHGLSKSEFDNKEKRYISIDWDDANINIFTAEKISNGIGIDFKFIVSDSVAIQIEETDLLFIDTDHRYRHLMKELRMHNEKVSKYIILHDTSGKYENWEDYPYDHESRKELRNSPEKYGMWAGVVDFLRESPNWRLLERGQMGNGMTVLERVTDN